MTVTYGERTLPILREADVVVAGGSFAGVAAAVELARSGRRVVLVESRTYLGRELMATLRPWIALDGVADRARLPALIRACIEVSGSWDKVHEDEVPLHPDKVKLCLEDTLLTAGVSLLYCSLPVGSDAVGGHIRGLVIGNKSGRQVLRCTAVVDATETLTVARLVGGGFSPRPEAPDQSARFWRTLEFDRTGAPADSSLEVPAHLGIADTTIRIHHGHRGPEHVLVECPLDLSMEDGPIAATRREFDARRRTMRLAAHLLTSEPAFAGARLAGSSYELHGPCTTQLDDRPSAWVPSDSSVEMANAVGESFPLHEFAGPVPGLWSLSEAGRWDARHTACLADPIAATRLGERFARVLAGIMDGTAAKAKSRPELPKDEVSANGTESIAGFEIREPVSPRRGWPYARQPAPPMAAPVHCTTDVLVVGGGSSGATAAITAAREGMRTALIDVNPALGGTGTLGGVDSYWYGRHVGFSARLEALVNEIEDGLRHSGGKWNIDAKMLALQQEAEAAGVETVLNAVVIGAVVEGNRVRGVVAATRWGVATLLAEVVVDATGDGDVAAFAGAEFVYGAARTHSVMWYSLAQFSAPGRIRNNFTSAVDVSNIEDVTRAILAGRRRGDETHDHGVYVATRESRHIRGGVTLTLTDQLRHRQWPDVVNVHYSNHDIKGQTESDWLRAGLIPPNLEVEIPFRALIPANLDGILIAGKAVSATHGALPAIRMQADLENLGGVVALVAAQAVRDGDMPRDIDLRCLQERLVREGLLPERVLPRTVAERALTDQELAACIDALTGEAPLYAYSDMHMGELFDERIPFVEVCAAGEQAAPLLERAHDDAEGPRRLLLAQALALCGSRAGVPTLVAAIERALAGGSVPPRDSRIRHAGFPPDQGAMPDLAYLVYSLGMARDRRSLPVWERLATLLDPTEEVLRDRYSGTFYYVDAIGNGAERLGDPAAIPVLQRLHSRPALRNQVCPAGFQTDFFQERQAMLELAILRALARCGSRDGYTDLIGYLDDARSLLAEQAHDELIALTGQDFGKDATAWTDWLARQSAQMQPCPLPAEEAPPIRNEECSGKGTQSISANSSARSRVRPSMTVDR